MIERKERVRRLDEYTVKRVVKLKSLGVNRNAIASRLDIAASTVDTIARKNGYGVPQKLYSDDELLAIVEAFMEGASNAEIAQRTSRTYWAIANKIVSLGLKRANKFAVSKNHAWHQEQRQSYLRYCND